MAAAARATASSRALTKSLSLLGRLPKLSSAPTHSARALGIVRAFSALVSAVHGGGVRAARVVEVAPVLVKDNDVCVRMLAAPINPSDINSIEGTWQTYIVKGQSVWQKIDKNSPIEYAATISINPPTALRMLEDFTSLDPDVIIRGFDCAKWGYEYGGLMPHPNCEIPWHP
ncbi:enoyl-[acyl-carrier-protein] reductase, mitochondrial [Eucalyptus grandis]|uniref:enoyl-[acyl-carrier-protein] reductase, mitochondrial n=1 Tax=Eucalyptus grandis TaxID=71139 RepID=UPI00192E915D|nr:enoyl-[acyl-carrier-protein] reductase, mitochondrial [Eucalyptus grandis]